jgi:multiple sugar transport system permease protein
LIRWDIIEKPLTFLGNPDTALASLIFVIVWKTFPFSMVMLLGALQAIPEALHDAAQVDGATPWQRIRYITIPSIMPVLLTTVTLELIWGFNQFDVIKMMTGGGPLQATEVISFRVYDTAFFSLDFGYGSAMSMITFLILMVFVWIYIRLYIKAGVAYGHTA